MKKNSENIIFHKWKKQLLIADKLILLLVIIFLGIFRPDALMIGVYFLLIPYIFLTSRKKAFYYLGISSLIALFWMIIANNHYFYNRNMYNIAGLNSFPLFAWASGLFVAYIIYSHWEHKFHFKNFPKKLLIFSLFYWIGLISLETLAYHLYNIQNLYTATYAGLPICDCIHAPRWMQVSYLLLGPLYFSMCKLIGLKNPHHVKNTQG